MLIKFVIPLEPKTKKNHSQIITNPKTKRPMLIPSKEYKQYEKDCGYLIPKIPTITEKINVCSIYHMKTKRKVDINNLHSALHDILTKYNIVEDDNSNIIGSTDGSRVKHDKENPRTEVIITPFVD